jgi:hypothetical protein
VEQGVFCWAWGSIGQAVPNACHPDGHGSQFQPCCREFKTSEHKTILRNDRCMLVFAEKYLILISQWGNFESSWLSILSVKRRAMCQIYGPLNLWISQKQGISTVPSLLNHQAPYTFQPATDDVNRKES